MLLHVLGINIPPEAPPSVVKAAERPAFLSLLAGIVSAFILVIWTLAAARIVGELTTELNAGGIAAFTALLGIAPQLRQVAQLAVLTGTVQAVHERLDAQGAPAAGQPPGSATPPV